MAHSKRLPLLLATSNRGKVDEIVPSLEGVDLDLLTLTDIDPLPPAPEEGVTFAEIARRKARHYHLLSGFPTLADDSGLEVEALGGAPGVRSARLAPTDPERIALLLSRLDEPEASRFPAGRRARFVCALCLCHAGGCLEVEGAVKGRIAESPRGVAGFGYDPVFFYPPLGRTFAELTREEKNRVSHRARALQKLVSRLQDPALRASLFGG